MKNYSPPRSSESEAIAGVNNTKFMTPLRASQAINAAIALKQDSTSSSKTSHHTPTTTGAVVNGQTIDSGETLVVTGSGAATVVSNSGGYIHNPASGVLTYLMVNSGSPIKRVTQLYQGLHAITAIGSVLSPTPTDMIHVEFTSGGSAACTYWKTGVGTDQQLTIAETVASIPNLNDGTTHELVVEVDGDFVTAFVDGVVVGFWWDANVSTVTGNWYYTQLDAVTASAKIYGFSSYDTLPQSFTGKFGNIFAAMVQSQGFQFGRPSLAGFAPDTPFYVYSESGDMIHMAGSTNAKMLIEADGSGHPAYFIAKNALDVELYVGVGGSNGVVNYQGTDCITFPVNGFVAGTYMQLLQFSTTGIVATSWPTSDPTGGKLWLKGGLVRHGTDSAATAASSIGLGPDDTVRHELIQVGAAGTDGEIQVWDETASVYRTLTAEQVSYQAGLTSAIQPQITAQDQSPTKIFSLQEAKYRPVRIYYGGTSISNNSNSRLWLEGLKQTYGDSGNYQPNMSQQGGTFDPVNGWAKQRCGCLGFYRNRADNTATPLVFNVYGSQLIIRYAKDSGGGSWTVQVDGSLAATIDSSGTQAYNQETVVKLGDNDSYHKISLVPPAGSGYAYCEGIEVVQGTYYTVTTATTNASPTVTVTSATNIALGQQVYGAGIPANTKIIAISGTTVTLSNNATATAGSASLTYFSGKPGITISDGTLGGSSVKNFLDYTGGAGVTPISPSSTYAGFDSYLLNQSVTCKYDVIYFAWVVNDAGSNTGIDYYTTAIARLVASCQTNNQQLILVIEPGGHFEVPTDSGANYANYVTIRNLLLSYVGQRNVTVIDWSAMLYPPTSGTLSDWQTWGARWYERALSITSITPLAYTGDFIHPIPLAHALLQTKLNQLASIQATGKSGVTNYLIPIQDIATQRNPRLGNPSTDIPHVDTEKGVIKYELDTLGVTVNKFQSIGQSSSPLLFPRSTDVLWVSETCGNLNATINTDIAASSTSDKWGKFLQATGSNYYTTITGGTTKKVTCTAVVGKGAFHIRPVNNAFSADLQCYINGVASPLGAQAGNNLTDDPVVVHVTCTLTDDVPIFSLVGKFYAAWVTPTEFPCVAPLSVAQISAGYASPFLLSKDINLFHTVSMDTNTTNYLVNTATRTMEDSNTTRLQTGTTASSVGRMVSGRLFSSTSGSNTGGGMHNGLDWAQPLRAIIRGRRVSASANGILRIKLGPENLGLIDRGVGIEIRDSAIWLIAHNGTTLTQTNTGASVNLMFSFDLRVSGGTVQLYNKGTLIGTTTGAPTTIGNPSENRFCLDWLNGTDTTNNEFWIERNIFIIGG